MRPAPLPDSTELEYHSAMAAWVLREFIPSKKALFTKHKANQAKANQAGNLMTNKHSTADAPALTQALVDAETDPGMREALQSLFDSCSGPTNPGLAALEAKYGPGKIPLSAVHESELDFEDKKMLFLLAGFDYDGTAQ